MAAHPVTLRLPAPLFSYFQNRAERARRSLEAVLLEAVATVAAEEDQELSQDLSQSLADLDLLTDEELWRAARNRLSEDLRLKLEALNLKQQRETLTPAEKDTLGQLVHHYDRAVLLRAQALRLLKERGQDVSKLLIPR
jgi:hypothetical protein